MVLALTIHCVATAWEVLRVGHLLGLKEHLRPPLEGSDAGAAVVGASHISSSMHLPPPPEVVQPHPAVVLWVLQDCWQHKKKQHHRCDSKSVLH